MAKNDRFNNEFSFSCLENVDESLMMSRNQRNSYNMTTNQPEIMEVVSENCGLQSVKVRIGALKKLQLESVQLQSKYFEELQKLNCFYATKFSPIYEKRAMIVNAVYEPSLSECDWTSDEDSNDNKFPPSYNTMLQMDSLGVNACRVKGVPCFWLQVLKNSDLKDSIKVYDEVILSYLKDIKLKLYLKSFVLEFHFEPNEYFVNSVLTKEFYLKLSPDEDNPLDYSGPTIVRSKGCHIDWRSKMNVTRKRLKLVRRHRNGTQKITTKIVSKDSFFNLFSTPEVPDDMELDEEAREILDEDFGVGCYFRDEIVPKAVNYFIGDAEDSDEDNGSYADDDSDASSEYESGCRTDPRISSHLI